ncbi:MAG TPA: hypothetical protein VHG28_05495 [Longimicrobiaceae bacterium]|nr:hypothetical protein [Longimicrobiaceae bacterium]
MVSESDGAFPFTRDEVYQALRLIESEAEAQKHADEITDQAEDKDWAISEELLMLLSLVSDAANRKADSLRFEIRDLRKPFWLRTQQEQTGLSDAVLEQRWQEEVSRQEQHWIARREEIRRRLHRQ